MDDPLLLKLATVAAATAALTTVVLAVRAFFNERQRRTAEADRVAEAAEEADIFASQQQGILRLDGLAAVMRPKTVEEMSMLRRELSRAGMRANDAVSFFSVVRSISMLSGASLFLLLVIGGGFTPGSLFLGAATLLLGLMGPNWWLRGRIKKRQEALARSLPSTLDLLVTCMEAGLGLEQALARVSAEIGFSDPEIAEELSVVIGEMRAGLSTAASFKKLADRVTSDEVRNMSNVIVQSSTLGASLGRTLREYAASARRRRELALEEVAGKITAGLTLPLCLCLLPSAMIAMLGPAVVIVMNSLFE